jgi:hypothetical protein
MFGGHDAPSVDRLQLVVLVSVVAGWSTQVPFIHTWAVHVRVWVADSAHAFA